MNEILKRIQALEKSFHKSDGAYLTVTFRDGTRKKMLWCDAMMAADVANVEDAGGLADLVRIFIQKSSK